MAKTIQIKCINKSDRPNPHERILNVGGLESGNPWKWPSLISSPGSGSSGFK